MKKIIFLKLAVTLALFWLIFRAVPPSDIWDTVISCSPDMFLKALLLLPLFLFLRMVKWFVLAGQAAPKMNYLKAVSGYLWGMALGLVTPGKLGEMARIKGTGLDMPAGSGIFFLEKFIETAVLGIMCSYSLYFSGVLRLPFAILTAVFILASVMCWRLLLRPFSGARLLRQRRSGHKIVRFLNGMASGLSGIRIFECFVLTLLTFLVYCLQVYLLLVGLNGHVSPEVMILFPLVLLGNLVPFTLGGFGAREGLAALIVGASFVSAGTAVSAFFIATVINIALAGFVGLVLNIFSEGIFTFGKSGK
jgi:glycosyltransferase 2 family protein